MTSWSESELDSDDPMVEDDDFEDDGDDEGPDELEFGEERSGDWGDDDSDEAAGW